MLTTVLVVVLVILSFAVMLVFGFWMMAYGVTDLKVPEQIRGTSWLNRMIYLYFAHRRREALSYDNRGKPDTFQERDGRMKQYLERIKDLEGEVHMAYSREAIEIWNEGIFSEAMQKIGGTIFPTKYDEYISPVAYPRLSRQTAEALGNPKLLKWRDREDRVRRWQARRAARKLGKLALDSTEGEIPESEAGRHWIEMYCQNEPDLVRHALQIAYPQQWIEVAPGIVLHQKEVRQIEERLGEEYERIRADPEIREQLRSFIDEQWTRQRRYDNEAAQAQEHERDYATELSEYARLRADFLQAASRGLDRMDEDGPEGPDTERPEQ